MIFDCFTILNELDLLEIRLRELYDTVDYFVLVEAPVTFSGKPKPLYYNENRDRFKQWSDKIIHVIPNDLPTGPNAWEREHASREHFKRAINNHNGNWIRTEHDDIITICDVDEIPRASALRQAAEFKLPQASLHLKDFRYKANLRNRFDWYGAKVVNGEFFNTHTVKESRYCSNNQDFIIRDAGWHLTYQGDLTQIKYKCDSFSHHDEPTKPEMYARFEKYGPVMADRGILEWTNPLELPSSEILGKLGWTITLEEWESIRNA